MKYIHRIDFLDQQRFDVELASTIDEVEHITDAGFQKYDETKGIHVYRRSKRFGN